MAPESDSDATAAPNQGGADERDYVEITLTEAVSRESRMADNSQDWVSLREAAQLGSVSISTLRRWYRAGKIESRIERGQSGDQRMVRISEVIRHAGPTVSREKEDSTNDPREVAVQRPLRSQATHSESDVLPIEKRVWDRLLHQLGNLHEAGQQLAEARERAVRAEERYAFEVERQKVLEERIEELEEGLTMDGAIASEPILASGLQEQAERQLSPHLDIGSPVPIPVSQIEEGPDPTRSEEDGEAMGRSSIPVFEASLQTEGAVGDPPPNDRSWWQRLVKFLREIDLEER